MFRFGFAICCAAVLAGCSSHEGQLKDKPLQTGITQLKAETTSEAKPVAFHYAPGTAEYKYATITLQTPAGGVAVKAELDFTVKTAPKGKQFTNDSTIDGITEGEAVAPPDRFKMFHVQTTVDALGKVVSSRALADSQPFLQGRPDLGASFALPTKPLKPGDSWTETVGALGEKATIKYTLVGIETVGKQRVATFEKVASNKEAELKPTVIKIDADTGVLIDKLVEFASKYPNDPNRDVTTQFEVKLR